MLAVERSAVADASDGVCQHSANFQRRIREQIESEVALHYDKVDFNNNFAKNTLCAPAGREVVLAARHRRCELRRAE